MAAAGDWDGLAGLLSEQLPKLGYPTDLSVRLLDAQRRMGRAEELGRTAWRLLRHSADPRLIAVEAVRRLGAAAPQSLMLLRAAVVLAPDDATAAYGITTVSEQRSGIETALRLARRHDVISGRHGLIAAEQGPRAWASQQWTAARGWFNRLSEVLPKNLRLRSFLQVTHERLARERAFPDALPIADLVDRLLPAGERTAILFVGARGEDVYTRYRGIPPRRLEVIGIDPVLGKASRPRSTGIALRYLAEVISDKDEERTFFEAAHGGGSSLFKASAQAGRYLSPTGRSWGELLRTKEESRVRTTSLDAIRRRGDLGRIDAAYVNIQGGELAVLVGGREAFADVMAVQVEVSFVPHYEGAPDWRAVDAELVRQGFVLIDIRNINAAGRTAVGLRARPESRLGHDRWPSWQVAEAQLLYLRDPLNTSLPGSAVFRSARSWLHFALWAEYYGQVDIALEALMTLAADPGLVDDPELVEALGAAVEPIIARYRSFMHPHYG